MILAATYLLWIVFRTPIDVSPAVIAAKAPTQTSATSRPDLIAILGSRSLREEAKPPPAIVTAMPAVQVARPPDVEVVATIINPGEIPSAYVRSRSTKKLISVKPGTEIFGATVKSITEGEVIFQLQGQDFPIQVGRKGS